MGRNKKGRTVNVPGLVEARTTGGPSPAALLDAMKAGAARAKSPPAPAAFRTDPCDTPLAIALSAAVPLRIAEYKTRGGPSPADVVRVRGHAQLIGEKGDVLQMGGGKKGEAAAVFAALADGLAVMAFCPGGVRFAGTRYEASA